MKIPGRVGYQCSNFYRQLIREGIIIDDNYYVDSNNQLTFRCKNRMEQGKQVNAPRCTKRQSRSIKREEEDGDSDVDLDLDLDVDMDLDRRMKSELKSKRGQISNYYDMDDDNCLPVEFIVGY